MDITCIITLGRQVVEQVCAQIAGRAADDVPVRVR
jgi:hypothetical protein